jgi:hypothetical protein
LFGTAILCKGFVTLAISPPESSEKSFDFGPWVEETVVGRCLERRSEPMFRRGNKMTNDPAIKETAKKTSIKMTE